jgi:hypothetical protein
VPNLAWVSQVSQTKVPINSAIIPPSRTVLFGAGMDRMNRWAAAPMGAGASRWLGGWAEAACSIIGLIRSYRQPDPAISRQQPTSSQRSATGRTGVTPFDVEASARTKIIAGSAPRLRDTIDLDRLLAHQSPQESRSTPTRASRSGRLLVCQFDVGAAQLMHQRHPDRWSPITSSSIELAQGPR